MATIHLLFVACHFAADPMLAALIMFDSSTVLTSLCEQRALGYCVEPHGFG
jgi:hypothetical protein